MYKALIIGCGNIGAMYDLNNESVSTYAKAFHLDPEIEFDVYDIDTKISSVIAKHYGVNCLYELGSTTYLKYDLIVISTSTSTHYEYLSKILPLDLRLVICEKPVDIEIDRLEHLIKLYNESKTKVMVNFFRRFLPKNISLKQHLQTLLTEDPCTNIIVTYQRGFHNNASHAIDLLEFLFETNINLSLAQLNHKEFDEFISDPTMSVSCDWNGVNLQFIGLSNVKFSHFEIAIYTGHKAVLLKNGGNEIELLVTSQTCGKFYPQLFSQTMLIGVNENYMINVVSNAKSILNGNKFYDNFVESVSISKRILQLQKINL